MSKDFNQDECMGFISEIQRYSTKDGPGIRTTVFLMGCNLRCKWCSNPELIQQNIKLLCFENKCKLCGACLKVCGPGAISIIGNSTVIDRTKCNVCGNCVDICPNDVYEKVGYFISAEELGEKLLRDKAFYDNSNGGVTFSGGEPALQPDFVLKTARFLKENGVHTALDTAGLVKWENLKKILKYFDLVLLDLKAYDRKIHQKCTEVENDIILANAKKIADMNMEMIIRIPIIPGWNNSKEDILNVLLFIKSLGSAVKQVDLLNYHNLADGKYYRLGINRELKDLKPCSDEEINSIADMARDMGLKTTIGG